MIVKMLCTFDFNPETNEYTPIGTPEIVKEKSKKTPVIDESSEPEITLLESKYILNQAAITALGVEPGDRININYDNLKDNPNLKVPIIGSSKSWGHDLGNKLTKSSSVSYRGVANTVLAEYGSKFTLEPYKDGLFVMRGDKPIVQDDNIEVPVDNEIEEDIDISQDLLEDENFEISDIDFNFEQQ